MELDVTILGAVAVTVFLALMFFGVVVLWDVALALRSLGDKLDKLEDTFDEDLTEIGYSLERLSNAPGGGGAQLHLSGGTISAGPSSDGEVRETARAAEAPAAGPGRPHPVQSAGPVQAGATGAYGSGRATERPPGHAFPPHTVEEGARGHASPDDPEDHAESGVGQAGESTEATDLDEQDAGPDGDLETEHPRAQSSRGRFVTPPHQIPWYATPLDRDAIIDARPKISGELEEGTSIGDREDEVDTAGDSSTPDEADEANGSGVTEAERDEPIAVEPSGDVATVPETDTDADTVEMGPNGDVDSSSASESESDSPDSAESLEDGPLDGREDESAEAAASESLIEDGTEVDDAADSGDTESGDGGGDDDGTIAGEPLSDGDDQSEPSETAEAGDTIAEDTAEKSASGDESSDDTTFEYSEDDLDGENDPLEDAEDIDEDLSADEAIDTVNDETPGLSLASHEFDVTADRADETASITFEFEENVVEITGSTRRLLRYQMRSFADQESTPDADISIDPHQVTIEIEEADGAAIQRWRDAAVNIIDRTLFLSDDR